MASQVAAGGRRDARRIAWDIGQQWSPATAGELNELMTPSLGYDHSALRRHNHAIGPCKTVS